MPVDVQGLRYTYGRGRLAREVLREVSFSLDDGEVAVVTGPSGSGKTTLLTVLGALRPFTEGAVTIHGVPLAGLSSRGLLDLRRRIGFIFQRHNLLKSLSVLENVESGLHLLPESDPIMNRGRAEAMLAAVGLGGRGLAYPDTMSGGEQQRVAVARALVRLPDLIIADEPTASLDAASGRLVAELIQGIARKLGCVVIMATHDERVFDIATRRLHMADGVLHEQTRHSGADA